ncbi:hypothetical protein, partial [Brucella ceti]
SHHKTLLSFILGMFLSQNRFPLLGGMLYPPLLFKNCTFQIDKQGSYQFPLDCCGKNKGTKRLNGKPGE